MPNPQRNSCGLYLKTEPLKRAVRASACDITTIQSLSYAASTAVAAKNTGRADV